MNSDTDLMRKRFRLAVASLSMTRTAWIVAFALAGTAGAQVTRETPGWFPFRFDGHDARPAAVDLSALNEKPAGKDGFLRVADGVIKDGAGRRVRWFGFNLSGEACFPPKGAAPKVAARLAKMGANIVRLHHMDYTWGPGSLIRHPENDRVRADLLDRLDFFVAELKKQGIYVNLNLHVSRTYPGTPEGFEFSKGLDHFYPPFVEAFKQFARDLITHRNPYTGLTYAREPAVACIEVNNENTLGMFPLSRWGELPEPFAGELKRRWVAWLRARYDTTARLRDAWGVNDGSTGRELIDNPNLEAGARGWVLENHGGARSSLGAIPGGETGVRWTITRPGEADWHLQLNRPSLDLAEGGSFRLTFRARGDASRPISITVMLDQEPWSPCGLQAEARLATGWQRFSYDFVAAGTRPRHVRVNFSALNRTGTIDLADVSLRPVSSGALRPEESLEQGFSVPLPATSPNRTARRDLVRFLVELEREHATETRRFLKEELGARQITYHSQVAFGGMAGALREQRVSDLVDTHAYWQHPEFPGRAWDPKEWRIANTSQLADPRGGELTGMALQRVEGMPFTVSEYNIAAPSDYTAEAWPVLAAFAAFQEWDGLYLFDYLSFTNDYDGGRLRGFFTAQGHPAHEAFTPVAALLFRRAMVRPAMRRVSLQASEERIVADQADRGMWGSFDRFWSEAGISRAAALKHRLTLRLTPGDPPTRASLAPDVPASGPITSDTGETTWDAARARFTLNAPGARMLLGKVGGATASVGDVRFEVASMGGNEHAYLALVSLDGEPLAQARRILLVALGRAENEGMGWNAGRTSVGDRWGRGPALVQGVEATITLPGTWRVEALDPAGAPKETIATAAAPIRIKPAHRTLWYLLTPAR
jgi:hypothetical protein